MEEGGNDDSTEVRWLVRMNGCNEVEEDVHMHEVRTFPDGDKLDTPLANFLPVPHSFCSWLQTEDCRCCLTKISELTGSCRDS